MPDLTYLDKCPLIGIGFKKNQPKPTIGPITEYETELVGKVRITQQAINEIEMIGDIRYIIAGICKNRSLNKLEPVLIDSEFLIKGYLDHKPPFEFEEKCHGFLINLYLMGGNENHKFHMTSFEDSCLGYSTPEEFIRIIDQLESDFLISIDNKTKTLERHEFYHGLKLTKYGKEEVEKSLPKMPMVGLVNQDISTGYPDVDNQINHAKDLFFSEPPTFEKMRSACETLSYVLEPLRKDLSQYFSQKDINAFFQIVNTFDIRHNKEYTNELVTEEQLEWVFYTLLNTINTFVKLKNKNA
jgi:hypothetical protein